jgi:DNA invertase Pin-like site-specific DNA recombinase
MTKRVALYGRISTDTKNQTVENQLRELQAVGARLGWMVVAVYTDEGVSGAKGRDKRPGFDALLKGVARREFDLIAAWSVCRLERSLQDLIDSWPRFRHAASISICTSRRSTRARRLDARCSSFPAFLRNSSRPSSALVWSPVSTVFEARSAWVVHRCHRSALA